MYSAIIIIHRLIVTLFLLHYVTQMFLLFLGKQKILQTYRRYARLPEIIVIIAFLFTGGWMLYAGALFNSLMVIKLVAVFLALPIASIGFNTNNKGMAIVSVFLLTAAYGFAEMNKKAKTGGKVDTSSAVAPVDAGRMIYQKSCIHCHGEDGRTGGSGSKDLSVSTLSNNDKYLVIRRGRNAMPGYKEITDDQVNAVIEYINTLK